MGFSINVAIGWGMSAADFFDLCRIPGLPDPHGPGSWYAALEKALSSTGSMKMPGWPLPLTGPKDTCLDLMSFVGYDDWSDVLLYPSIGEATKWHRRNDDLDYATVWGPRPPDDHDTPMDRVEYLTTGFHPYGGLRMHADGSPAIPPEDGLREWERDPWLLPGVPRTLRHWTTATGLLDTKGISRLRPMRAVWWA